MMKFRTRWYLCLLVTGSLIRETLCLPGKHDPHRDLSPHHHHQRHPNHHRHGIDFLSVGSHVGAAVGASIELAEDMESIGHGHGMLLLCCSKLCREINVLREAATEEAEFIEETKFGRKLLRPLVPLFHLLSSQWVSVPLAIAALFAAVAEVLEDTSPGGHHGAVLLAIHELLELSVASHVVQNRSLLRIIENLPLRLAILVGATFYAVIEIVRDLESGKVGGHHGVAILAFCKGIRCLGLLQTRLLEKED